MDINPVFRQWALDEDFLHGRMSFICGPRQIGKTTLAKAHLQKLGQGTNYYNWDSLSLRQKFASSPLFFIENLNLPSEQKHRLPQGTSARVVFDEIHKYPQWKNILKGYYDEWKAAIHFIIIGSARLDYFRHSGDSLVGRYFLFKMNPCHPHDLTGFSLDRNNAWHPKRDLLPFEEPQKAFQAATAQLLDISGFPEPFHVGTKEFYERWKENHISLITGEDVRDLSKISSIQKLQTLVFLLPERVGAPLSLNNLRNILQCAHATLHSWMETLKKVYLVFDVAPYTAKLKRAVSKERKFYFWDWGILEDPGKRLENFVAVQLERAVSAWTEWGKGAYELMYLRTKDGREVDFIITEKNKPLLLVECKSGDKSLSSSLIYFKERLGVPAAVQVLNLPGFLKQMGRGVFVAGLDRFLQLLP